MERALQDQIGARRNLTALTASVAVIVALSLLAVLSVFGSPDGSVKVSTAPGPGADTHRVLPSSAAAPAPVAPPAGRSAPEVTPASAAGAPSAPAAPTAAPTAATSAVPTAAPTAATSAVPPAVRSAPGVPARSLVAVPAPGATAPVGAGGPGAPAPGQVAVTEASTCPPGDCVTIDTTRTIGPADHAASGIDDAVQAGPNDDSPVLSNLDTTMYRGAPSVGLLGAYDWTAWDTAAASGARTTLVLSDLWAERSGGAFPPTPWSDWATYQSWVRTTVQTVLASGRRVDYWDVYNEPGWNDYYSPADFSRETPADLLEQFLVTYQQIKAVDPAAAVIGPSDGLWSLKPVAPNPTTHEADLGTFLRFAAAHGLHLAAIAWHDNGTPPAAIYADEVATRALVSSLPQLGHPAMFLDEFASAATQPIPGWDVGYLAAATAAGFASAGRSCWDTCSSPDLDALLGPDGLSRTSDYYDRVTYAAMTGRMASVAGNDPSVQALGSIGSDRVVALVGRSAGCGDPAWCAAEWRPSARPAPPVKVTVRVLVPWTVRPRVTLTYDPFVPGAGVAAPAAVTPSGLTVQSTAAGDEWVDFTIPAFADGAAYSLTLVG